MSAMRGSRFKALLLSVLVIALTAFAACGDDDDSSDSNSTQASGETESREVTVAITPTMPYIGLEDDELTGLDGDLFNMAAENLGLEVKPVSVDFTGLLAGVETHRYDLGIGNISWTEDRAAAGIFTDPPYYSAPVVAVRSGVDVSTVADLEGKKLATVQAFFYIPALEDVPDASLQTYPTFEGVLQDLSAGRVDVAFLDPLTVVFQQEENPSLEYETASLVPPTQEELEEHPEYSAFLPAMSGWYLNSEETELEKQLTEQILGFYEDGTVESLVEEWGGDPKFMLQPRPGFLRQDFIESREKVDRSEGWEPPSI